MGSFASSLGQGIVDSKQSDLDWFSSGGDSIFNDALNASRLGSSGGNASWFQGIDNWFTGNLDYKRTLDTLKMEQEFNALEAAKARDWQKMMSDTAHQREANDLLLAGYNPALTLTAGGANAYNASSASSPGARSFSSGKGFDAMMQLIMGLVSLGVNNARKIDALDKSLDMADKKLNATMIQNDAKLDAMSAHWNAQDSVAKMKLASYDYLNLEKAQIYKNYLDNLSKFKKNWR